MAIDKLPGTVKRRLVVSEWPVVNKAVVILSREVNLGLLNCFVALLLFGFDPLLLPAVLTKTEEDRFS